MEEDEVVGEEEVVELQEEEVEVDPSIKQQSNALRFINWGTSSTNVLNGRRRKLITRNWMKRKSYF